MPRFRILYLIHPTDGEFSIWGCGRDCRNAINYINNRYKTPYKYAKAIQATRENTVAAKHAGVNFNFVWIPGHTNYRWNEEADALAKEAAKSWTSDAVQEALKRDAANNWSTNSANPTYNYFPDNTSIPPPPSTDTLPKRSANNTVQMLRAPSTQSTLARYWAS